MVLKKVKWTHFNNVYSCKKYPWKGLNIQIECFTMGRQELLAKNIEKLRKLGKLKRPFLKFFKYYYPPSIFLQSSRPQ